MSMRDRLFDTYAPHIAALPARSPLLPADLLIPTFRLERRPPIEIYYIPFEHMNAAAKLMLVGITPGWTQMELAYRVARDDLRRGVPYDAILRHVAATASFAGPLRANLVTMLDGIGVPEALRIPSSSALFAERSDLLHATSVLAFPVFVNDRNYTGSSPHITTCEVFRRYIFDRFRTEVAGVRDALIVPLGDRVRDAVQLLVTQGSVAAERCLFGFPHPSSANGHRQVRYRQHWEQLRAQVQAWFSDPPTTGSRIR